MKTSYKKILLFSIAMLLLLPAGNAFAQIAIISNPDMEINSLRAKDVLRIFLRKKKTLSGRVVKIAIQKDKPLHAEFVHDYIHKTPKQFTRYYKKMIFTGKGRPPKKVRDDAAMLHWVATTPGAIGYISAGTANDTVKVIVVQQ